MPSVLLICAVMLVPLLVGITYAFHDVTLLDPLSGDFVVSTIFANCTPTRHFGMHCAIPSPGRWPRWRYSSDWDWFSPFCQRGCFPGGAGDACIPALGSSQFSVRSNWAWFSIRSSDRCLIGCMRSGRCRLPTTCLRSTPCLVGALIANVWWGIPFFAITLLAALQSIPTDIYEAAAIDGAGPWVRFRRISCPFSRPPWHRDFAADGEDCQFRGPDRDHGQGRPGRLDQILASYIFTQAFQRLDFGYASAVATVLLALLLAYAALLMGLRTFLTLGVMFIERHGSGCWVLHYALLSAFVAFALFLLFGFSGVGDP